MFRSFLIIFLLAFSISLSAATERNPQDVVNEIISLNDKLSFSAADEAATDELIAVKNILLHELLSGLKLTEDFIDIQRIKDNVNLVTSHLIVNQDRKNTQGILRDKIKLDALNTEIRMRTLINQLIEITKRDDSSKSIGDLLNGHEEWLKNQISYELPGDDVDKKNKTYLEIVDSYRTLMLYRSVLKDIILFSKNNLISHEKAISDGIGAQYLINTINQADKYLSVNTYLRKIGVDLGSILTFLLIFSGLKLLLPLISSAINLVFDRIFLTGNDILNISIKSFKHPVQYLVFFIVLDVALNALFYRYKNEPILIKTEFVFYVFIGAWLLFKLFNSLFIFYVQRIERGDNELRKEVFHLFTQCLKGVVVLISIAVILAYFDINVTAILSTLGIGGLAFALAAKDSLSNLLGGINIMLDNLFGLGDWVVIDKVEGNVIAIGLRSTTIRTFENARISVPNANIANANVTNWSKRTIGRRIKMTIGLSYQSDMVKIKQAVNDIKLMLESHPQIAKSDDTTLELNDHTLNYRVSSAHDLLGVKSLLLVYLEQFNTNSIDMTIYCFSKSVEIDAWYQTKEDIMYNVAKIIENNDLKFAEYKPSSVHQV